MGRRNGILRVKDVNGLKKTAAKKQKGMVLGGFIKLAFLVFVVYAVVNIVSVQVGLSDKRNQLATLEQKKAQLELDNEEYERLLSVKDNDEYMKQYAIEKLDYAYPSEVRFYDTSRG